MDADERTIEQPGLEAAALRREIAELRQSEGRFRRLAENARDMLYRMSLPDGRYEYVSPASIDVLGYSPEQLMRSPMLIKKAMHPEWREYSRRQWEALLAGDMPPVYEYQIIHGISGEPRWIHQRNTLIKGEDGKPVAIEGIVMDISDRKRTQDALRESEERFREVFENMGSGVAIYEAVDDGVDFVFKDINPAGLRIAEATRAEHLGRSVLDVYPGVKQLGLFAVFQDVWRTGVPRHYPMSVYEDQRITLWVENYVCRLPTGEVVVVYDDISERKRAENALVAEKLLSEEYINSLPGLFYVFDKERFIRWNAKWRTVTGYSDDELAGKYGTDFFEGDDRKLVAERMREVFREGVSRIEADLVTKDGRRIPYYLTGLRKNLNGTDCLIGLGVDITERRRAEQENVRLGEQVRQAQKMEAVARLAGGVAHDFNNMLSVILGNAEMALDLAGPSSPLCTELREIQAAAERSADLTRQLLAYARKQTVSPEVLGLNETVAGTLKMLQRLIGEDVHLVWLPGEERWPVRIDPGQIDQVLVNLCVNARDAIVGVGRITIETASDSFDRAYCADHAGVLPGDYAQLVVSDNGCGMDAETLANIFEPFFTTKGVGEGTGLGLSTVYGIVKQNGGFINVCSEPGHGSTFRIYLPRHACEAEQRPARDAGGVDGGSETILLVEDEPTIVRLGKTMLERLGYHVLAAATPGEAVELARAHAGGIHLLLTDVVMPEMNGRDLAKRLLTLCPGLKRLFMSGYTANVIAHHGVLDDGVHFLQKPFSQQDLAVKVREALAET